MFDFQLTLVCRRIQNFTITNEKHKLKQIYVNFALYLEPVTTRLINPMITRLIDRVVAKKLVNITETSAEWSHLRNVAWKNFIHTSPLGPTECALHSNFVPWALPFFLHSKILCIAMAPSDTHVHCIPSNKRPSSWCYKRPHSGKRSPTP